MAGIHSRYEANQHIDEQMRIVMVGKTGIGKSATGNTILGRYYFESKFSSRSLTDECCKGKARVDGQMVAVIDTPGLFDTRHDQEKTKTDICQCISYCSPGPHIFLVVVRLGRFTEEEKQTVQTIQDIFGLAADRYSMVLFTHGDLLNDTPIEEFIRENPDLQELVRRCNGQYHIFNNTMKDRSQVTELLRKIRHIVKKNGGSHYTNEMFQRAERAIEAEKQRILREKADQIRRETEELERRLRAEYDEKLRHFMGKLQSEWEEEKKERRKEKQELNMLMNDFKRESVKKHIDRIHMEMAKHRSMQSSPEAEKKGKEGMQTELMEDTKRMERLGLNEKKEKIKTEKEKEKEKKKEKEKMKEKEKKEREMMEKTEQEKKQKDKAGIKETMVDARQRAVIEKLRKEYERELKDKKEEVEGKFEIMARQEAEDREKSICTIL